MHDEFSELCLKIKKYADLATKKLHCPEWQYENSEITYLIISQWLKELRASQKFQQDIILGPISTSSGCSFEENYKSKNTASPRALSSRDDSLFYQKKVLQSKSYCQVVGFYNLFTNELRPLSIFDPKKPKIFVGSLEVSDKSIAIETIQPKISIDIIGHKYRLAKNKIESRIDLDMTGLKAFGVVKCTSEAGSTFEIKYTRHTSGYDEVFCLANSRHQLEVLVEVLEFLQISPQKFLNCKIRLYIGKKVDSKNLVQDISYFSKNHCLSDIILNDLIDYLEDSIMRSSCDLLAYELYLTAIFYKRVYRIKDKERSEMRDNTRCLEEDTLIENLLKLNVKESSKLFSKTKLLNKLKKIYNRPRQEIKNTKEHLPNASIVWNQMLDFSSFARFSKNIDAVLNLEPKSLLHKLIYIMKYHKLGIKFETEYIRACIPLKTCTFVESVLIYKIYRECNLNTDETFFNETLEKLSKTFCKELNYKLKNHIKVSKMFDDLVANFDVEIGNTNGDKYLRDILIHDISSVFLARIHKVCEIEQLKEIFNATVLFEKVFKIKNLRLEKMLKDKALKFMKDS